MANLNYTVKTRNWYGRRIVLAMLSITQILGVQRCDSYADGDGKFYLETRSAFKAWAIWVYFMFLSPVSGGWTYIVRPSRHIEAMTYRSIY